MIKSELFLHTEHLNTAPRSRLFGEEVEATSNRGLPERPYVALGTFVSHLFLPTMDVSHSTMPFLHVELKPSPFTIA